MADLFLMDVLLAGRWSYLARYGVIALDLQIKLIRNKLKKRLFKSKIKIFKKISFIKIKL